MNRNKFIAPLILILALAMPSCGLSDTDTSLSNGDEVVLSDSIIPQQQEEIPPLPKVTIEKELLYDQYTLEDVYSYRDSTRRFQWEKIREGLELLDATQRKPVYWAVLQNRRDANGTAPLTAEATRNKHNRMQDRYGVERYQSIPLYGSDDLNVPTRYGRDGSPVVLLDEITDSTTHARVATVYFEGEWMIPIKYLKILKPRIFQKVIFVDRTNQNIAALEKAEGGKWLVRSMNKSTTGANNPPYQQKTPLGIFVVQEKKRKMYYLADGTQDIAGFSPYASRFSNGGYIHGIPVNKPRTTEIETSATLGTIPRSHMCVRVATSHANFIYDWASVDEALVYVIE